MKKYTLLAILMCFSVLTKAQTSTGKHHIKYLDINSGNPDIGVTFLSDNQIVFATTPSSKIINTDKYNPLLEFYKGEIDESGAIINKEAIKAESASRSKTSKSGATFSKDGKTVYFSENKYAKRKSKKIKHELFKASVDDNGNWTNIEKVSFNKRQYSYRYPSINKDHTRLYFVSDATPSFGGSDLFYVDIKEDGSFGEPINLGDKINTSGNETTPFIADNNFLYFSSDGREDSLGNMDVYASEVFENAISEPLHLASPINSLNDDYAYIVNAENKGFFSSNRLQGRANDDIYSFYIEPEEPKECMQEIVGTVRDQETESLIADASINILDEDGNIVETLASDASGNYRFTLSCRNTYTVTAKKANYSKEEHIVNTANYYSAPPLEINQLLTKEIKQVTPEKVVINVNPIYFRFDKYSISSQAAVELDRIVEIMKENPALIVESASHTDSRGPKSYNQRLSEKRAKATVDYIVSKGIERSRITAKGYGESQLINNCQDGVRCSIEKHRLNRRTEFVIMNKQVLNDIPVDNNAPILKSSKITTVAEKKKEASTATVEETATAGITFVDEEEKQETIDVSGDEGSVIEAEEVPAKVEEPQLEDIEEPKEQLTSKNTVVNTIQKSTVTEVVKENVESKQAENQLTEKPIEIQEKLDQQENETIIKPTLEATAAAVDNKQETSAEHNSAIKRVEEDSKEASLNNVPKKIEKEVVVDTKIEENGINDVGKYDMTTTVMAEPAKEITKTQKSVALETTNVTDTIAHKAEEKPTQVSDFLVSNQSEEPVNEKNIVLENEAISYNNFNRDFTKDENSISNVSRNLFDESDDFDSYSGNETNSKRLVDKVSTKKAPETSFSQKAAEIRKQFEASTKDIDKKEILSVNAIDVSPMSVKRNGKYIITSSAKNVDVMRINFQIKNNNQITPGYKEVFILIQNPEGQILNRKGTFEMNDGKQLTYTEKTNAYYNNDFLNLSLITDRFLQKITRGPYTVIIYIEGYPVGLEMFELS